MIVNYVATASVDSKQYKSYGCGSYIISLATEDPFAGSGTTCVAAYQAGRNYLGIELDPNYYAIASQRLATEAFAIAA